MATDNHVVRGGRLEGGKRGKWGTSVIRVINKYK